MNAWVEGFNQRLIIAGFRGVKIEDVDKFFKAVRNKADNACVQFFDASFIAGSEHLRFAVLNALSAFKGSVNISNSLAMETLLYASAQRQIKEAVRLLGIKRDTGRVAVVVLNESRSHALNVFKAVSKLLGGRRDDSVLDLTEGKVADLKRFFGISDVELEVKSNGKSAEKQALADLVIEHMALLVTRR